MKEQEKLAVIIRYCDGMITGAEAARQLGLSLRQVQRKKKAYLAEGMSSVIHKSRNRTTGRGFGNDFATKIISLYECC
ncbi:helix-turn-helix domain-containing protein [Candidatus Saccharibacteria bacterium]|nr:helix-turn-helix domain-containing protein [Candidatus Saccharibacteria bacterium]